MILELASIDSYYPHPSTLGLSSVRCFPRFGACLLFGLLPRQVLRRFLGRLLDRFQTSSAERRAYLAFDLSRKLRVFLEIVACVVFALADAVLTIRVPGA